MAQQNCLMTDERVIIGVSLRLQSRETNHTMIPSTLPYAPNCLAMHVASFYWIYTKIVTV